MVVYGATVLPFVARLWRKGCAGRESAGGERLEVLVVNDLLQLVCFSWFSGNDLAFLLSFLGMYLLQSGIR